jgi:hypothetical protein
MARLWLTPMSQLRSCSALLHGRACTPRVRERERIVRGPKGVVSHEMGARYGRLRWDRRAGRVVAMPNLKLLLGGFDAQVGSGSRLSLPTKKGTRAGGLSGR